MFVSYLRIPMVFLAVVAIFSSHASVSIAQNPPKQDGIRNSTQKIRVKPNELAKKAGTAVNWETDLAQAIEKSRAQNRPVFWYVPSVPGTFMDRKPEIDRYMLAGPFSWPAIINLLNERSIPLRATPTKAEADHYGLKVYDFIEPGFMIIGPDQSIRLVADRLTTLHPHWLFSQISGSLGESRSWSEVAGERNRVAIDGWWEHLQMVNWRPAEDQFAELRERDAAEFGLLAGMVAFRMGQQKMAREIWEETGRKFPEHPLGWKAANEAQGIGPFVRGFEVFGELPELPPAKGDGTIRLTSGARLGSFSEPEIWRASTEFLLLMQDESGGFFDSDYDFGGTDSLPNVHVAVTSLVGLALIQAEIREPSSERKRVLRKTIEKAAVFVANDGNLNFDDRDEILWAQAYRVRLLAAAKGKGTAQSFADELQRATTQLEELQMDNGSWFHEYPNAFVTATALTALHAAQAAGGEVNSTIVNRGLERLEKQRFQNGGYPYAVRRGNEGGNGDLKASAGRIPVCELARHQWGRVNDPELITAIETGIKFHEYLAKALKYDDHTSTMAYGGFFFWYDMQARSEAISRLADAEQWNHLAAQQREIILTLPEIDGAFVDSHELGRCYGTAMALISLADIDAYQPK
ncbi:MAG: hypothetical protein KF851_05075 [Pirellulaceae bacterium]|nr:hypothetical protein [Pirellulaceae bacterium]